MQNLFSAKTVWDSKNGAMVKISDITQSHPMSNTDQVVQEIHDILFSYYKVARKRFVDSVCMQAAAYFLIDGPGTPLALFSPAYVSKLNATQLNTIAGEDHGTRRLRSHLKRDIASLEAAKKILK